MDVNPNLWQLLSKVTVAPVASPPTQGWVKITKVLDTPTGCVVQTSTAVLDPAGAVVLLTEAAVYVPGVKYGEVEGSPALVAI